MFVLFYVFSNIFVFQYSFSRGVESYHSAINLSIHGSNKDFPTNSLRFQEKEMSHYIQYKLLPCREHLTVYRQTDRVSCRGASLPKSKWTSTRVYQPRYHYFDILFQKSQVTD